MSVITKIISIVLKSVADNKISNELAKELIGVSIDEVSEAGINQIKDFIIGEKTKIDNILSTDNMRTMNIQEENIDYVNAEIKYLFSKFDVSEEVLRQCKYDSTKLKDYFWNEYSVSKSDYIECESDIKKGLYAVSEAILKLVRESEEFENDVLIQISNSVDDIRSEEQTHFENIMKRFDEVDESNNALFNKVSDNSNVNKNIKLQEKVKSRTQEYADKWDDNMFLNNFDKRDENAGVNVKLSEVYLDKHLPHYIWGENKTERSDLKDLLYEYIYEHNENKMLLILGQPGVGKSTLITWITANFVEKFNDILVYKFASDLKNVDWQDSRISSRLLDKICLNYDDMDDKILILDGFDELSIEDNKRRDILDSLYGDWIYNNNIKNFSLIITCRVNYIQRFERIKCKYITLQSWDEIQIRSFCMIFKEKTKNIVSEGTIEKFCESKAILGIPLILYMILALNISVEKEESIVEIYDKIFSLEGGIYDRSIDNKKFADNHRIGEIKEYIHQISRDLAIWMFENNPVGAYIPKKEYQKISNYIMKNYAYKKEDFKIGNFFKVVKHCEGIETEELYFVHRSIYEYFVAEAIYNSIEKAMIELTDESQEELACKIPFYLKQGLVTKNIDSYLQYKILKLYNNFDNSKKECFYQWWENAIQKMINKGMFFFTSENIQKYENIIEKEIQCFYNLVKILRLLLKTTSTKKYILENVDKEQLEKYIRFRLVMCRMEERYGVEKFNLSEISLAGINLSGVDFTSANLNDANLSRADLSMANFQGMCFLRTNFQGADLSGANLKSVNLIGANLRETDLKDAKLVGSLFSEGQIKYLKGKYDLSGTCVDIPEINKVVDYEEYCKEYL